MKKLFAVIVLSVLLGGASGCRIGAMLEPSLLLPLPSNRSAPWCLAEQPCDRFSRTRAARPAARPATPSHGTPGR